MPSQAAMLVVLLLADSAATAPAPPALSRRALLQQAGSEQAAPAAAGLPPPAPAPAPEGSSSDMPTLEWPLSGSEWAMFVLAGVAMFIMAGAGVGGGMLLIPIFQLVGGMDITYAVALSSLCIGVSSIISVAFYLSRDHPLRPGPMVDWDLLLLFSQPVILGSTMGAMFNVIIPEYITNIILAALVTPTMWRMGVQAVRMHRAEVAAKSVEAAKAAEALAALSGKNMQVDTEGHIATWGSSGSLSRHHTGRLGGSSSRHAASQVQNGSSINGTNGEAAAAAAAAGREVAAPETSSKSETGAQGGGAPEAAPDAAAAAAGEARPPSKVLRWMLREERARVPPVNFALLVAGLTGLVVTKVASSTALACGSWQSWVLQCSVVPILGLIYLAARAHVLRKQRVLGAYRPTPPALDPDSPLSGLSAANGYLHFTARNTLAIAAVCVVAGIIAGLVGLGGGIVLMPLMIELQVHPQVASAVSQCSILLTSIAAVLSYAMADRIPWAYGYVLMVIAVITVAAGQVVTEWLVRRHEKPSIILYILVGVGAIACGVIYYQTIDSIVNVANGSTSSSGGSLCSS